jgi:hypothetical protein
MSGTGFPRPAMQRNDSRYGLYNMCGNENLENVSVHLFVLFCN